MEDVEEDKLKAGFDKRLNSSPKDRSESVRISIDSVKYNICDADPGGATLEYVTDLITALYSNRDSYIING